MQINLEEALKDPKEISVTKNGQPVVITKDSTINDLAECNVIIRGHKLVRKDNYTGWGTYFFCGASGFGSYKENELKSKGSALEVLENAYAGFFFTSE